MIREPIPGHGPEAGPSNGFRTRKFRNTFVKTMRNRHSCAKHSPPRRGVSQLSCGQAITVRNFPLLGSGPILSRMWPKKSDTAAVSVGRVPSGACFGEPVEEFDPRPVRNNIGDAQPRFVL